MEKTPKKTVYLVRHGQSIDNASPVFQSEESPLSPKGQRQARQIATRISKLSFDSLISSHLPRAAETANFISKATGKQIEQSELFAERRKPQAISGKPWKDELASKTWRRWEESLYTSGLRVDDGENYDKIVGRVDSALDFLVNRAENTIVVVTHGFFLRAIVARVLLGDGLTGPNMRKFQTHASMENTGITVLHYRDAFEEDSHWRLWTYNDHAHFAE